MAGPFVQKSTQASTMTVYSCIPTADLDLTTGLQHGIWPGFNFKSNSEKLINLPT